MHNFHSSVYSDQAEMIRDMITMSRNVDLKGGALSTSKSTDGFELRDSSERTQVLVETIEAERRYNQHLADGGTELVLFPTKSQNAKYRAH